jgi:hypothetical protein
MPADPAGSYRVSTPGPVIQQLKAWADRAEALGIQDDFAANLNTIQQRLSNDPLVWGEQRRTLRGRNLPVHHAAVPLLHVEYAVDEQARVVFVMAVRLMANSPLGGTP